MFENENTNHEQEVNQNTGYVYRPSESVPQMQPEVQSQAKVKNNKKKSGGFFKRALMSITFGLFFGVFAALGLYAVSETTGLLDGMREVDQTQVQQLVEEAMGSYNLNDEVSQQGTTAGIGLTQNVSVVTADVSDVVEEVMPAMVSIKNEYVQKFSYFGQVREETYTSSGSGIIVGENDTELLIATNHHVVEDASKLTVVFTNGAEIEAVWKGSDKDMDLAVIAIPLSSLSEEVKSAIAIAKLGDSESLRLGEPVIAIGNALGIGQSVSGGYVSAIDREVTMSDGSKGVFIQTDAAINQGNSGGALLNIKGEVIGINSSKIGGELVEGMGFAIPISAAQPILEELMAKVTRTEVVAEGQKGYIGIRLQTVTEEDSLRYDMPTGIYVYAVMEDSAASAAGLRNGDIITKFDKTRITSNEELQNLIQFYSAGETVELSVMRRNQSGIYEEMIVSLTLGKMPEENS